MQSSIADRFETATTFDRITPAGSFPPRFTDYTGPFAISPTGSDGLYTVDYLSVDGLGNVEPTRTLTVVLDTTAPAATIVQPAAVSYPHSATLVLNFSVSDGSGSGVARVVPTLDGSVTLPDGTSVSSGRTIDLLTQLALGSHAFNVRSDDNVGNSGASAIVFSIVVTADSIKDDVRQFFAAGKIRNSGMANSLLAKLDAGQYQPFIHELHAQSGQGIDASAAAIMTADAQFLLDHAH